MVQAALCSEKSFDSANISLTLVLVKLQIPISVLCLSLFTLSCSKKTAESPQTPRVEEPETPTTVEEEYIIDDTNPIAPLTPEEVSQDLARALNFHQQDAYVARLVEIIMSARGADDVETIKKLMGNKSMTPEQLNQLKQLIENNGLRIDSNIPFQQIGELKANKHARWAINLKDNSPIVIDVKRDASGNWKVDKLTLPPVDPPADKEKIAQLPDSTTDALNYTHTFLNQLLKQDFQKAKSMVDLSNISDAKLAVLCIIFEESAYQIDKDKPLRALFIRDTAAGFYANVVSKDGAKAAQFSIITQREKAGDDWKIYEINLDKLLGDYAKRVSGGDVYYTPLLKNPQGGDTLVIYFEFDSEGLTPRTQRQLSIVTALLRLDPNKTITISGHTDAKGGKEYNEGLSNKRAESVRAFFVANGVSPNQVVTEAHGAQHPRMPNTNTDGSDNPDGRKGNRRTEIYLDF